MKGAILITEFQKRAKCPNVAKSDRKREGTVKSSLKMLVVGLVLVGAFQVEAQNLLPSFGDSNLQVQVSGYTHIYSLPDSKTAPRPDKVGIPDDDSDIQWGLCRVKMDIKSSTPFGGFVQIEAVDLDDSSKNWLRQAHVSYKANDDWSFNVGRLFVAASASAPSPFGQETVRCYRWPFAFYAYGAQVAGNLGNGWSILSDVTGKSGVSFDSGDNWDGVENSTRLQKKITKDWSVAGTVQLSEDFEGVALDSAYQLGKLCLRGTAYGKYMTDDAVADTKGFYTYAGYEVLKGVELHGQYDHQVNKDDIWTVGTRLWAPKNWVELTVDYEMVNGQSDDNRVIARLETRF